MKISAYFTTRNCIEMGYDFEESIKIVFNLVDEIVVCDSSDGKDSTEQVLNNLKQQFSGVFKIVRNPECNWSAPNAGVYDGLNKAFARSHCTGDYCIQLDVDEHFITTRAQLETVIQKSGMTDDVPILSLPVVEYWGGNGKVRIDINVSKWRISKNLPFITHGIPVDLRKYDNGLLFAKHGTDGCCYINKNTGQRIPHINFIAQEKQQLQNMALYNSEHIPEFERWFNSTIKRLPFVKHYSWYSIEDKIIKYKLFWNSFWPSLYNENNPEGHNPFFPNRNISEATNDEIKEFAKLIESKSGGHIFHRPWNEDVPRTNHITVTL